MPNTQNEPFVQRIEMSIMQLVILDKAQQGEVTRDNLKSAFKGNLQMSGDHFDHCIQQLVQDGHLREVGGNKYTITDDGREDIQKLVPIVQELPNVVTGGGRQQQNRGQQTVAGGYGAGTQNPGQPKGGPGQSSYGQNR